MAAILHVRCPIGGCGHVFDATVDIETWGDIDPTDIATARVTLSGQDIQQHILAHGTAARLKAMRAEYAYHAEALPKLDEHIARAEAHEAKERN